MAEKIGVENLKGMYDKDMTKFEQEHETAKTFVDTRYAGKRAEGYGKSKDALKAAGGHLKTAGNYLWEGGKATAQGIEAIILGTIVTIGAPIVSTAVAGYETIFEGGYDTLRAGKIAGTTEITTRAKAFSEKSALGGKLTETKVRATLAYAGAAQAEIDTLNGEIVPFEDQVAALREEIKKIETEAGAIKGDKFDMAVERNALIKKAEKLQRKGLLGYFDLNNRVK